ncbi:hypothetical protein [Streptomyces alboflavus]|uniref:hypothetical protein n=1 Tax=Streptomyces alboflavus TaxID=67267 RepID=UPI001F17201B|nr:hypothetical protein [Streptomyces alboflavus]
MASTEESRIQNESYTVGPGWISPWSERTSSCERACRNRSVKWATGPGSPGCTPCPRSFADQNARLAAARSAAGVARSSARSPAPLYRSTGSRTSTSKTSSPAIRNGHANAALHNPATWSCARSAAFSLPSTARSWNGLRARYVAGSSEKSGLPYTP